MKTKQSRFLLVASLALMLSVTVGLASGSVADAKKKKAPVVNITNNANLPIPDATAGGPQGQAQSTITVGKKFKGKLVGDVNVTVQTTGSGSGAANQLNAYLKAPNGRTALLFSGIGGSAGTGIASIGPFTMDSDTSTQICDTATPPCANPDATLNRPFAGTAEPPGVFGSNVTPAILAAFNGVPVKGSWTLKMLDFSSAGPLTSTLNLWRLNITPAA